MFYSPSRGAVRLDRSREEESRLGNFETDALRALRTDSPSTWGRCATTCRPPTSPLIIGCAARPG